MNRITLLLFMLFLAVPLSYVSAQQDTVRKKKPMVVVLEQAQDMRYSKKLGEGVRRVLGDVIIRHDSIRMFCDSAYMHDLTNSIEAFGHVHVKQSDTLSLFGNRILYNGNTRVAEVFDSVRLVDNDAILYTDYLLYDRNSGIANYISGGKIVSEENVLTSIKGYYYTNLKEVYFRDSVVIDNPQYVMYSDTLRYNTQTEIARFLGPTRIISDENNIYCENGWYNTQTDLSSFNEHARMESGEQTLFGDSLFYDRNIDFGQVFRNVQMIDTVKNVVLQGNYAQYSKRHGFAMLTDSARAIMIDGSDSLFMHADTLAATFDTLTNDIQRVYAYNEVRMFRHDMQMVCDSLLYSYADSVMTMYRDPVMWAEESQLTGDSIKLFVRNSQPHQLELYTNCFIVNHDTLVEYNQIKGKNMTGYFVDGELSSFLVTGNAETLYFVRDDDNALIGINKAVASTLTIFLDQGELSRITYRKKPKAKMLPDSEVPQPERRLRGFNWHGDRRPLSRDDIFRHEQIKLVPDEIQSVEEIDQ